jgi:lysozyme family protein
MEECTCRIEGSHLVERCPEAERLWEEVQIHENWADEADPQPKAMADADEDRQAYEDHIVAATLRHTIDALVKHGAIPWDTGARILKNPALLDRALLEP